MIAPLFHQPLFDLGRVFATAAAWWAVRDSGQDIGEFLDRHVHGDWGTVFEQDGETNDLAVDSGAPIRSIYRTDNGVKIWIVTNSLNDTHGPRTTIYLPGE